MPEIAPKSLEDSTDVALRPSLRAIAGFLALIIISILTGYWMYHRQAEMQEGQVDEVLFRSAQIRAFRISSTLHERLGDAQIVSTNPLLQHALSSLYQNGRLDNQKKLQIRMHLEELKNIYRYRDVTILNSAGDTLITSEEVIPPIAPQAVQMVKKTITSKAIQMSSIYSISRPDRTYRMVAIGAPIFSDIQKTRVTAILLLRFDAEKQIYPALQPLPIPNLPNDVLLVEIRGREVLSLSDSTSGVFHFLESLPINPGQIYESVRIRGGPPFHWRTKDGLDEITVAQPIEGTPWFVAAVVPKDAKDALARNTFFVAAMVSTVMLSILGIGIVFWWKFEESKLRLAAAYADNRRRLLQKQYDYLLQYANDMIILVDADYNILVANDKALHILGYSRASLLGKPISMLSPQSQQEQLQSILGKLRRDRTAIFEAYHVKQDGSVFPVEVSARAIDFEGKTFIQFICRDITERKEAELKIQLLAYYDNVTKLPNRTLLNDRLERTVQMALRSARKVGILFMDLDNFKNINDSLGHQVGDALLFSVGQRIVSCIREEDTVARIGGDEFLVMLPDLERGEEAHRIAEKIIASFASPFLLHGHEIFASTSIGISLFPDDSTRQTDLIKYADSALYEAKSRGRNNYQFFTKELNEQIMRASRAEHCLRQALANDKLCLWYQPQIDARNGRLIGAEALLRWRDGNPEHFSAREIITVAEERGLITSLGEWAIREVCRQCRQWQLQGLHIVPVSVNVSPIQLQQKEFSNLVLSILTEAKLEASYLELEITETTIMKKAKLIADIVMRLRQFGVRISIDDFGKGYSSLSYLTHIHVDKIKIDRAFILRMLDDTEDETITQAIIRLAEILHLRVLAEGVEQQEQMKRLLSFGCHEAQGFLYSQAVHPEIFTTYLENKRSFKGFVDENIA